MQRRIEPEKEWEKPKTPIEILVDRYVDGIANSMERVEDLFPPIFYDSEEIEMMQMARRLHLIGSTGLTRGFNRAIGRYRRQESPPLYQIEMEHPFIKDPHQPKIAGYRINREFYAVNEFYQTDVYQHMHDFLVRRLVSVRHLDIKE